MFSVLIGKAAGHDCLPEWWIYRFPIICYLHNISIYIYIYHIYPLNSAGQKLKNLIYVFLATLNSPIDIKPQEQNPWFIDYRSLPRNSHMDSPCVLFMKAQRPPGCISPFSREEMRGLAQVDLDGAAEQELQLLGVFRCTGHCHGLMGCWR